MARKTPCEQVAAARDMLRRAQTRQRQADTRTKIVLGALMMGWLQKNAHAAQAFNGYINNISVRDQDMEVIADFLSKIEIGYVSTLQSPPASEGPES